MITERGPIWRCFLFGIVIKAPLQKYQRAPSTGNNNYSQICLIDHLGTPYKGVLTGKKNVKMSWAQGKGVGKELSR